VIHIIDYDDDNDDNRETRKCGVHANYCDGGQGSVFAVPVCCDSGSMYFSVEHLLGGPVIRQTTE
jgi:hypothetical protein